VRNRNVVASLIPKIWQTERRRVAALARQIAGRTVSHVAIDWDEVSGVECADEACISEQARRVLAIEFDLTERGFIIATFCCIRDIRALACCGLR